MNTELSLTERIKKYFERHAGEWINATIIGELSHALPEHYKPDTASRRLRELAEEGYLDREERKGNRVKSVFYKWHDFL